jgi:hypothetical protein
MIEEPSAGTFGGRIRGGLSYLLGMLDFSHSSSPHPASPRGKEAVPGEGGSAGPLQRVNDIHLQPYNEGLVTRPIPRYLAQKSINVTSTPLSRQPEDDGTLSPRNSVPPHPDSAPTQPVPHISHVTPSSGPMGGGIRVGILGSGFPLYHACTFGGSIAITERQTETDRVCILPSSPNPGPVEVRFQGVPVMGTTQIFTYEDTREKDACVLPIIH